MDDFVREEERIAKQEEALAEKCEERQAEKREDNGGDGSGGTRKMLLGLMIGIAVTLAIFVGYGEMKDYNQESIVKSVLSSRGYKVDSVEVLQYSTYQTQQGTLKNVIAQGSFNGYLYQAKVQFLKGRAPADNGFEFKQGGSTISGGMFYNF